MKTIGFIDYFLSEWHANNYPAWIKEAAKNLRLNVELGYAWAELDISPYDGVTTQQWCDKYNVKRCETIEEVCEKSDYLIVLSPDNPERHLSYAKKVLPYGKPTYIDKTFAPSLSEAKLIFELSERFNAPIFSSSALRCADELNFKSAVKSIMTTGGGSVVERYIVHQVEMVTMTMGIGAKRLMVTSATKHVQAYIDYGEERYASVNYSSDYPFSVSAEYRGDEKNNSFSIISSDYFYNLIKNILIFFGSAKPFVPANQTLEIISIIDAIRKGLIKPFQWIDIDR